MEVYCNIVQQCPTSGEIRSNTPPAIISISKDTPEASRFPSLVPLSPEASHHGFPSPVYCVVGESAPRVGVTPAEARHRRLSSPEKPALREVSPSPTRRRLSSVEKPSLVAYLAAEHTPRVVVTPAQARRRLSSAAKPALKEAPPSPTRRRLSSAAKPALGEVSPSPTRRRHSSAAKPSLVPHLADCPAILKSPACGLSPATNLSPAVHPVADHAPQVGVNPAQTRRRLSSSEIHILRDVPPRPTQRRLSTTGIPSQGDVSRNPDWRCLFTASTQPPVPQRIARPAVSSTQVSVSPTQVSHRTSVARCSQVHHPVVEVSPLMVRAPPSWSTLCIVVIINKLIPKLL